MKQPYTIFSILTAIITVVMLLSLDKIACRADPNYGFMAQVVTVACVASNATLAIFAMIAHTRRP